MSAADQYQLMHAMSDASIREDDDEKTATELQRVTVDLPAPSPKRPSTKESAITKKKTLPLRSRTFTTNNPRALPLELIEGHQVSVVNSDRQNLSHKPYTLKNVLDDGMCVVESEGRYKMVPRATVKPRDYFPKMKGFYQGWGMCELFEFKTAMHLLGAEFDFKSALKIFQMLDIQSLGYLKFQPFFNWVYGLGRNEDRGRVLTTFECVAGIRQWDGENPHYVCRVREVTDEDEVVIEWLEGHVVDVGDMEVTIEADDADGENTLTFKIPKDVQAFREKYDAMIQNNRKKERFVPVHGSDARDISIVVVGGHRVGKSALLQRFVRGTFPQQYDPTIEDSYRKMMNVDNTASMLHILDTAGQEEFASMRYQWLREVDVLLVCYTPMYRESLNQAEEHLAVALRLFRQSEQPRKMPVFLVETQTDRNKAGREVNADEMKEFIEQLKEEEFEFETLSVSAQKGGQEVEDVFSAAVRAFRQFQKEETGQGRDRGASNAQRAQQACNPLEMVVGCVQRLCPGAGYVVLEDSDNKTVKNIGYVPKDKVPDGMSEPVFSTRHFSIRRECSIWYFLGGVLTAILFPFVILLQNFFFWFYSDNGEFIVNLYPDRQYYVGSVAVFSDFLHTVVGRHPEAELTDEVKKDSRRWFLRQTCQQKCLRLGLVPVVAGALGLAWVNFFRVYFVIRNSDVYKGATQEIAIMEDAGPIALWFAVWFVLSFYMSMSYRIRPSVPSLVELRPHVMYFNADESIRTTAYVFMRGFAKSVSTDRQGLEVGRGVIFISTLLAVLFALTPGITRAAFKDPRKPFFAGVPPLASGKMAPAADRAAIQMASVSSIVINMLLLFVLVLAIQIQILSGLDNYTEWMEDITALLDPDTAEERGLPYLALSRQSNLVSWIEMRTFLFSQGLQIFARQEVFIFSLSLLTMVSAVYLVWRMLTDNSQLYQSETFNGFAIVFLVFLFAIFRLLLKTRRIEAIQKKQVNLLAVQGFNTYYQRLTYHPNDANADDEFSTLPDLPDDEEDLSSTQQATSPLVNELATANAGEWSLGNGGAFEKQFSPDYLRDSEKLTRDVKALVESQEIVPRIFNVKLDVLLLLVALAIFFSVFPVALFTASGSNVQAWQG